MSPLAIPGFMESPTLLTRFPKNHTRTNAAAHTSRIRTHQEPMFRIRFTLALLFSILLSFKALILSTTQKGTSTLCICPSLTFTILLILLLLLSYLHGLLSSKVLLFLLYPYEQPLPSLRLESVMAMSFQHRFR